MAEAMGSAAAFLKAGRDFTDGRVVSDFFMEQRTSYLLLKKCSQLNTSYTSPN